MKRDIKELTSREFDLCVIGGGITGASVAWDAASRGLSVALLEKGDFSGATSAATSKLAHGGLRYLKNAEFGLVRESLRERRILEYIAPHLVYPMPFLIPTYKDSTNRYFMIKLAMVLYDLLSFDKSKLDDPTKRIPSHRMFTPDETVRMEPGVKREGLTGGGIYYDCQMYSPERLTLAFILSAAEKGAVPANYARVNGFLMEGDRVIGVRAEDLLGGGEIEVRAKVTANVAGPWADIVLGMSKHETDKHLIRSQGIHLVTRAITKEKALVLQTPGGRHFFIIPWRGHSLIGTTDTKYEGDPDQYQVTEESVEEFIGEINGAYPSGNLTRADVLFSYGGLRPIVEKETEVNVYDASRKYEIYDNAKDEKLQGLVTVIGGKYTTSRHLAQQLVDLVLRKLEISARACPTEHLRLHGGDIPSWSEALSAIKKEKPLDLEPETLEYLLHEHGSTVRDVLKYAQQDRSLAERLSDALPDIGAQVVHAVKEEMACTLSDFAFRRSGLATLRDPGTEALQRCAALMGDLLGWDEDRRAKEVAEVRGIVDRQGVTG